MPTPLWIARRVGCRRAFTLVEVLVAMTVLVILVGMITQMTNGVASVVRVGQAQIDTDGQARTLLDRMAIDFAAMVKRPDVDYYLKGRPTSLTQPGNDQIAFYSQTPGYFPVSTDATAQSPVSLIAYRVNSKTLHMERLCKGLTWSGTSSSAGFPMGFLPVPLASPLPSPLPSPTPSTTIEPLYPNAADPTVQDLNYEELGPQVFRFEYYYVLKGQAATNNATNSTTLLSGIPWNVNAPASHTSVNGMQDVAGIGVLIAVIDPKNRALVSVNQLMTLANSMLDPVCDPATGNLTISGQPVNSPGDIEAQWTAAVTSSTTLPRPAVAAIQIYTRCFYLNGVPP